MSHFKTFLLPTLATLLFYIVDNAFALTLENNVTISDHPIILIVSYDGFRYDYFDKVATPTMDRLKASGVRVPYMEPIFPTKTFPNHQAICTGLYAETHGIVDNAVFDPKYNKTLSGFNDDPGFWNYHPDVLPIWIRNEQAGDDRASGCLMWPGSSMAYGENDELLPTYFYPKYDGSVPWEDRVDIVMSWLTNSTKPANLAFLYFDEPDSHGHAFGPNAPETLIEVSNADNRTAYLVNRLNETGIIDYVNLILLSDHGMKEVSEATIVNITNMINPELLKFKHGGTPFLHLIPTEGRGDDLYNNLTEHGRGNNFTVWKKEDMKAHPYHYSDSRRILDYVVVADEGYAFDDFWGTIERYRERWNLTVNASREYGVHGYSNTASSMRPYFLANGPAFKKDMDHAPIRNVDLVPLISKILGLQEPPNNGSLSRVEDMISPSFKSKSSNANTLVSSVNVIHFIASIIYYEIFKLIRQS